MESKASSIKYQFPVNRWVKACSTIFLSEYDSCLPSADKYPEQRTKELEEKRQEYQLRETGPGLPWRVYFIMIPKHW
mgnify:CR=1 FL=1